MSTSDDKRSASSQFGRMARLVRLLVNGERLSAHDAAAALECHQDRTRGLLRVLHEAALVYVVRWSHRDSGPWFPVYEWCGEEPRTDAPRPGRSHNLEVSHG